MERAEITHIAHTYHPVAAPLDASRVHQLVSSALPSGGSTALDLGCGQGIWLMEVLDQDMGITAVGVDTSVPALDYAREISEAKGVTGRVRWIEADAASWNNNGAFDLVISVGASHVFDGCEATLRAMRAHLRPGGRMLFGDAFWEAAPSRAAQDALEMGPSDLPDLTTLVEHVQEQGFEIVDGHVSTLEEWDDYEWSWLGALVRRSLEPSVDAQQGAEMLAAARDHREGWLKGYRKELGFATLALVDLNRE